jgi:hypothetical protein
METIKANLGDRIITPSMATKGGKAKRGMLTQGENEIQDNIKTITDNRNQIKAIGYKGTAHGTCQYYQQLRKRDQRILSRTSEHWESHWDRTPHTTLQPYPKETWNSSSSRYPAPKTGTSSWG